MGVASARTCYSGKGLIYPEEVSRDEKAVALRDRIASSTLQAGHLTTRQHAHFVFGISGLSRQCIWSFLHSHPFYNSEQVSQRYVRVKPGNFVIPPLPSAESKIFVETVETQTQAYEKLIELLKVPLTEDYYTRFPARKKTPEKWKNAIDKRAFEVARYALGVGTTAYLYHTISALTLLRYARLCSEFETPHEQRILVGKMLDEVRKLDPLFERELKDPVPLESTLEYACWQRFKETRSESSSAFVRAFDAELKGQVSRLVSYTANAEATLATSVRVALGQTPDTLSDSDAIALVLDPKNNSVLSDTLNLSTLDRLSQTLHHVQFTFQKKISHTADSQDQRHRMVPASRPMLSFHYTGEADFITPFGITQSPEALELYERTMRTSFDAINALKSAGVSDEFAFYLLPNAFPIRMLSTGDLQAYAHKWKLRACYNAQEEIFRATLDEIRQVREVFPLLAQHLKAPCYVRLRAGVKPFCPEGDKFCGLPVWKYEIDQYQRQSL